MIFTILNIIVLLITLFIVKLGLDYNKKSPNNIEVRNLLPSEINYLYKDMTYMNRGILTTLLNLKSRNKIDIREYSRESRNKKLEDFVIEYEFTLLDKTGLKNHELLFLENVFEDKLVTNTDELTQRAIDGSEFLQKQGTWVNEIENELKSMGIITSEKLETAKKLRVVGLLFLVIGIVSLINNQITGLIGFVCAMPVLLISINLGIDKSKEGRALLNKFSQLEIDAKGLKLNDLSERELIELLALTLTMKYFIPAYEKSQKSEIIDLVTNSINEYDGSRFDDAILRGFMGYTVKTRDDTLDTNRIDYRLFK